MRQHHFCSCWGWECWRWWESQDTVTAAIPIRLFWQRAPFWWWLTLAFEEAGCNKAEAIAQTQPWLHRSALRLAFPNKAAAGRDRALVEGTRMSGKEFCWHQRGLARPKMEAADGCFALMNVQNTLSACEHVSLLIMHRLHNAPVEI